MAAARHLERNLLKILAEETNNISVKALGKTFIAWLKQNAFKRDVTGLINKGIEAKNLDQIIEIELGDEDLQDEIEIWRDNYYQVTAWYQLEYF